MQLKSKIVKVSVKSIIPAKVIIAGILAHVFVRIVKIKSIAADSVVAFHGTSSGTNSV